MSSIVLLSGGQDSTTCLYWSKQTFDDVVALSIFYGQRHKTEMDAAVRVASLARISHIVYEIPFFSDMVSSALTDASKPLCAEGGIPDTQMPRGLPTSFVPGRNALFMLLAGVVAVKEGVKDIVAGVCQTDYSGYPDCRREFVDSMERTLTLAMPSSAGPFRIHTPLMFMSKAETVRLARRLPGCWEALAHTVTCYQGERPGCGTCPSCLLRTRGFLEAGEKDPAL